MREIIKEAEYTKIFPELIQAKTLREVADAVGIAERTLYRRLDDPEFLEAFSEFNRMVRNSIAIQMADAQFEAFNKLIFLLEADSETVQLQAAKEIIKLRSALLVEMELDERLSHIEEEMKKISSAE